MACLPIQTSANTAQGFFNADSYGDLSVTLSILVEARRVEEKPCKKLSEKFNENEGEKCE